MTKEEIRRQEYGNMIGSIDWSLFITIHYYNGSSQMNSRRNIEFLNKRNRSVIDSLFFVSEKGKDNVTHTHLLVKTNNRKKIMDSLKPLRKYSNIHCVDIDPKKKNNGVLYVGNYLAKELNRDIDYDILINKNYEL